ncbi:BRO family protein [Aliivibrio salmonicida]|uniref:BRO family protein n=1 Tax=Aliivibrio salmonicida TaxID=40269 RepID=UPI00406C1AE0
MSLSTVLLSYDAVSGREGIRTITSNNVLYFSLFDVVKAIQAENRILSPGKNSKSILTLLKAHITHLLPREIMSSNNLSPNLDEPLTESYVTKAGLLRVVLQDSSPACIKFQEWVLDDVLPTVLETGSYNANISPSSTVPTTESFDVEDILRLQLQEVIERKRADAELKSEIAQLGNKVTTIEKLVNSSELIFVTDHPDATTISPEKLYELFSQCLRLCSSESQLYAAKRVTVGNDIHSKMFSRNVIDMAITLI